MVIESPLWGEMSRSDREGLNFNKIMIKKEYIQPTVKAVKINLPVVLQAISGNDGYKMTEDDNIDDTVPGDGSDAI